MGVSRRNGDEGATTEYTEKALEARDMGAHSRSVLVFRMMNPAA
jgi:hypothetical protein